MRRGNIGLPPGIMTAGNNPIKIISYSEPETPNDMVLRNKTGEFSINIYILSSIGRLYLI
jgi:hypothetical protein